MTGRPPASLEKEIHLHGGDPAHTQRRLGLEPHPVVDFSVNINPLGPAPGVLQGWPDWSRDIESYPTVTGEPVAQFYQHYWGLEPNGVLPGNGSVALMYHVLGTLRLRKLAIVTPSFHDYTRAAHAVDTPTISLPLSAKVQFAPPSPARLAAALEDADGLMLGHPNNPTGTLNERAMLLELARHHADKWVLVDEAFIQFVEDCRAKTLLSMQPLPANLLVFHSLTKYYALPGLRLGAVIGHPQTIDMLRRRQEPWPVSRIAERAAQTLLEAQAYEAETQRWIASERQRLMLHLRRIARLRFFRPTANFILGQWCATRDLDDLLRGLLRDDLHVRDCRNFAGLERNYFRFALRSKTENDRLLAAMRKLAGTYHV